MKNRINNTIEIVTKKGFCLTEKFRRKKKSDRWVIVPSSIGLTVCPKLVDYG